MPSMNEMWMAERIERAKPKVAAMLRERGPIGFYGLTHLGRAAARVLVTEGVATYDAATKTWQIAQ